MAQASRKVSAIRFVFAAGSLAHSAGLAAESMRTMPYGRIADSRSLLPMRQAFRTCARKRPRSSSSAHGRAAAGRRPHGRDQRAGPRRPLEAILSARRARSSSVESISVCGSNRNKSTPSNFTPSTAAAAVRFEHGVEVDGRLRVRPFADQPGPHGVVELGIVVPRHAVPPVPRASGRPQDARPADFIVSHSLPLSVILVSPTTRKEARLAGGIFRCRRPRGRRRKHVR